MKLNIKIIVAVLVITTGVVHAHHSGAMFDDAKTLELKGTVKEFQWKNPHVWIQVMVKSPDGSMKEWSVEGGGPNSLSRNGWRPSSFKPGEEIIIRIHPMRDGSAAGNFMAAKWTDGRTLGRWE